MKNLKLSDLPPVFIDTETTGLESVHEICQIAAVTIDGTEYEWKIMPSKLYWASQTALKMNGFNRSVWEKEARDKEEALKEFSSVVSGCQIIASNPSFDVYYLTKLLDNYHLNNRFLFHPKTMCISSLAAPLLSIKYNETSFSMRKICEHFDIDYSKAHDAVEDCKLMRECYIRLINEYKNDLL